MEYATFIEEVRSRAGFEDQDDAERAIAVTARALAERLDPQEAEALAAGLPEGVAVHVRAATSHADFDLDELYARVARREGTRPGFGREHAQAVCAAVGASLPEATRLRLQRHLPGFAALFEPRRAEPPPPRPVHVPPAPEAGRGSTLASGRPGSRHPLSEGAETERAHSQSVARSDAPHEDTKVSSARGLTQERLDETLAAGKSGPERPISETRR